MADEQPTIDVRPDGLSPEVLAVLRQIPQQPASAASRAEQLRVLHAIGVRLGLDVASKEVGREVLMWMFGVPAAYVAVPLP
jgi:hypothetical protein